MALARVNVSSGGRTPPVIVNVPTQSGTLTYSGSAKTPTWNGYDATQLLIGGTTSATDAGTYTATFTPQGNVTWSDGTSSPKSVTWTIAKATPVLTLSDTSGTTTADNGKVNFTVTSNSTGEFSLSSNGPYIAILTHNGNTATLIGTSAGTMPITVSQAATTNYAAASATYTLTVIKATPRLTLSATSGSVMKDETLNFTITTPSNGALSVTSSNTSVATATISSKTVTVTGVGIGDATITVSLAATDVYEAKTATYFVAVAKEMPTLTLSETSGTATADNGKVNFTVTSNSTGTITVSSSDATIASVAKSGSTVTVTGKKAGTVTITVSQAATTDYAAASATYTVTVTKVTPHLTLSKSSGDVVVGSTVQFTVDRTAYSGTLSVTSSDTSVATATISGQTVTVKGVSTGDATITVSLSGNDVYEAKTATFAAEITIPKEDS